MKKIFFVLAILVLLVLPFARAAQPGAATTSSADKGNYTGGTAGTASVISGHVYHVDLNGTQGTYKWVGIYGNVSGTIVLADSNNKQFYNWTGATGVLVYASDGTINWNGLSDEDGTNMPSYLTSGTDDYTSTFTGASTDIGSKIYTISSDYATPFPTASNFSVYSLKDGSGNLVWAGKVLSPAKPTYDGDSADFEMLLPENGTSNDNTATTYNFWVELQ